MTEFTSAKDEQLMQARIAIAGLQEWRSAVDAKLDALSTKIDSTRDEIIDAINGGTSLRHIDAKWLVAAAVAALSVLGGSVASVAEFLKQ
jgi:hypothetical protein